MNAFNSTHLKISPKGSALLVNLEGMIERVLENRLANDILGQNIPIKNIVDSLSVHKLENFLAVVKTQGSAFNWELNTYVGNTLLTVLFSGVLLDDQILVIVAPDKNSSLNLFKDITKINLELTTSLRMLTKEKVQAIQQQMTEDQYLFDEVSRLNNQLVTLQREIAKKNADLEKLNALKDEFLGIAAHDLRNPLSAIISYSEFMIDRISPELQPEHKEFLQIIHKSSFYMLRLVEDLLDVSTISQGQLKLNLDRHDLLVMVQGCVSLNQMLAQQKGLHLQLETSDKKLAWMEFDHPKMEQVINNLISNAIKFTPSGGQIDVKLEVAGNNAQISVKDTGPGIPPDEIESLFQMFSRTSVKSTQGERSTGLGLAIAKNIVDAHGATLMVKSEVGKGTIFAIQIPLERE